MVTSIEPPSTTDRRVILRSSIRLSSSYIPACVSASSKPFHRLSRSRRRRSGGDASARTAYRPLTIRRPHRNTAALTSSRYSRPSSESRTLLRGPFFLTCRQYVFAVGGQGRTIRTLFDRSSRLLKLTLILQTASPVQQPARRWRRVARRQPIRWPCVRIVSVAFARNRRRGSGSSDRSALAVVLTVASGSAPASPRRSCHPVPLPRGISGPRYTADRVLV